MDAHSPEMIAFVRQYVRSKDLADDIFQMIWITVWKSRKNLRKPETFRSWMYTIARRRIVDELKRSAWKIDVGHTGTEKISVLETGARSRLFNYTPTVQIAMQPNTKLNLRSEYEVDLVQGSLWLDVEKGGKGFKVDTELGLVRVTGTSFGVTWLNSEELRVDVSEGAVWVEREGAEVEIIAGEFLVIDQGDLGEVAQREISDSRPLWVLNGERNNKIAELDEFLEAYWDMDTIYESSSGTLLKGSGPKGRDAKGISFKNRNYMTDSPSEVLFGSAARFDSAEYQAFKINTPDTLQNLTDEFTIMAWVKLGRSQKFHQIINCSGIDGSLDELRVYGKVLSRDEIKSIAKIDLLELSKSGEEGR